MLSFAATVFSIVLLASSVLADVKFGADDSLLVGSSESKSIDLDDVTLKEICYRNLYADIDEFKVKNSKELVVQDTRGGTVFLSDGRKKAFDDVEYYFEEFCYKQYKSRSKDLDVDKSHGLFVGGDKGDGDFFAKGTFDKRAAPADNNHSAISSGSGGGDVLSSLGALTQTGFATGADQSRLGQPLGGGGEGLLGSVDYLGGIGSVGKNASKAAPLPTKEQEPVVNKESDDKAIKHDDDAKGKDVKGSDEKGKRGWVSTVMRYVSIKWEDDGDDDTCSDDDDESTRIRT